MDIIKIATQLLSSKLSQSGGNVSSDVIQSVIGNLLGGSENKGIDLAGIVSGLQNNGLAEIASSWLGDGNNEQISQSQLESVLGSSKVQEAASQLGMDSKGLLEGLQDMIPQVVDQSSKGGELLDSIGGLSGLAGLASKFFK